MKKLLAFITLLLGFAFYPQNVFAAGGIYASGGGTHTEGEGFSVTVRASGTTFNAFQGTISVSGPVAVTSISPGGATWVKQPSNGGQFIGMVTSATSSLTIATVRLKGTRPGSGRVSVSGVNLANDGNFVGSGGGSASFTITKAPVVPGQVKISSTTHPDQTLAYEATTVSLAWEKTAGVDGFSYLFDQVAETTPPAKTTSAETSITYENQAIGIYYFHIRAHNGDGWGPTTHFKVTIKEPDPKIDAQLGKPQNVTISKAVNFTNNIEEGIVSGIVIKGKTLANYTANMIFTPEVKNPDGQNFSVPVDKNGNFRLVIDSPFPAGYHKLVVQGQKDKILTPLSDEIKFEISQADGGKINILDESDEKVIVAAVKKPNFWQDNKKILVRGAGALILVAILIVLSLLIKNLRKNKKTVSISPEASTVKESKKEKTKDFQW